MSFFYILLGHLIGDFVLQTSRIAFNKPIHRRWNVLHASIVTLCMLVFAIPFGLVAALLTILAGVFHLFIDKVKPIAVEKYSLPELPAFIADQALHVAIIAFIAALASDTPSLLFLNKFQVVLGIVFVSVTFFAAIFNQYLLTSFFPRGDNTFFRGGEKLAGIAIRFIITLSIFLALKFTPLYLLMLPAAQAIFLLQASRVQQKPYRKLELPVRLLLDGLFSAAGACILQYFN